MSTYTTIKADFVLNPFTKGPAKKYLVLNNGIIESISAGPPAYPGMRHLDFTGSIVTPFFCDYHLHFSCSALAASERIAEVLFLNGINRAYEGGDSLLSGLEMKGLLKDRLEVRTSGYAIYKKGTYGKAIGSGIEDFSEARVLVDKLKELGVDYIKVINSGIFKPETGQITRGGFEIKELACIVQYAKECGLEVFCHANGPSRIHDAVTAGVSAIVHGLHVADETLDMMAEKKVAFIPTLKAFSSLSRMTSAPEIRTIIRRVLDAHLLGVKKAVDRGVKVLPGSDSGPDFIPFGKAYQEELSLLSQAGLTDEYILSSAVVNHLTAGMQADFLILKGLEIKEIFLRGESLDK